MQKLKKVFHYFYKIEQPLIVNPGLGARKPQVFPVGKLLFEPVSLSKQ